MEHHGLISELALNRRLGKRIMWVRPVAVLLSQNPEKACVPAYNGLSLKRKLRHRSSEV